MGDLVWVETEVSPKSDNKMALRLLSLQFRFFLDIVTVSVLAEFLHFTPASKQPHLAGLRKSVFWGWFG